LLLDLGLHLGLEEGDAVAAGRPQAVAYRMAACIVDLLEVVEVDEEQRADLPAAVRCDQRMLNAADQQAPVRQPGEGVEASRSVRVFSACLRSVMPVLAPV
jgi:hypothetical protein